MLVYRISKERYINDLTGNGARIYGGRWNQKGSSVIYTSETRALASLENLVHIPIGLIPDDLSIATIEINDKILPEILNIHSLPPNWKEFPAPYMLAVIGSNWISNNNSLLLKVPSVLIENEYNILINPSHSDIKFVKIKEIHRFTFDNRLLQ